MTTDRELERRLRDAFHAEPGGGTSEDLHAAAMARAARSRQRPRWIVAPSRGLGGGIGLAQQWLVLVGVGLLLVALAAVIVAGATRTREVQPVDVIVYNDTIGDIYSLDPETGDTALLIGGASNDIGPAFLPDGRHFIFLRVDEGEVYIANADGSGVRPFGHAPDLGPGDWSPDSTTLATAPEAGGDLSIIDVATGSSEVFPLPRPVRVVQWLTKDTLLLVEQKKNEGSAVAMWTINVDGTDLQVIEAPFVCCATSTLRGQSLVAWTSWTTGAQGRIHVLDTATGRDTLLASTDLPGWHFLDPVLSPDGKWLTAERVKAMVDGVQLVLLASDGSGAALELGPREPTNASQIRPTFSPDGTKLLATYEDGAAWLFDLPTGTGTKMDWPLMFEASWASVDPTP